MIKKFLCIVLCLFLFALPCSALSHDTYSDVAQSSTQAANLLSLASNYDDFIRSDFIIYSPAQYQYFIVWGEDVYSNGESIVSDKPIQYISYTRTDNYNTYEYNYGQAQNFSLDIYNIVTSNIHGVGMRSVVFEDFYSQHIIKQFLIFGLAVLFVILLLKFRKDN